MSDTNAAETAEPVGQESVDSKKEVARAAMNQMVLQSPGVLSALQDKLTEMVGVSSGYIESLPAPVKKRIKALKCLQYKAVKIECDFYKEVHELECKYAEKYKELHGKRNQIVNGEYEPNDEECNWASDEEDDDEGEGDGKKNGDKGDEADKVKKEQKEEVNENGVAEDVKGIPEFWLTVFKNCDMLQALVQDHDEEILKHLIDIQIEYISEPMGFKLLFHFSPNEYFSNSVLTKEYSMKCEPDEGNSAFDFEGPEIVSSKGCTIEWLSPDKNVTVKTVKKKQKHKGRGQTRTVTKEVKEESFFNYFATLPEASGDDPEQVEELEELLSQDFEVGHYLRETVIPRAVLCFTGEIHEDDDDDDDDDFDGGDDEGEDSEGDPDFAPPDGVPGEKPDCKQQ